MCYTVPLEPLGGRPVCRSTITMNHAIIYLIFDFPRTSVPYCRAVVGNSGGTTGIQRWKLNPNIGVGKKKKNFHLFAWAAGINFVFFVKIFSD